MENIKPIYKKERPKCPFYGFAMTGKIFVDQGGNRCALMIDPYSPCQMKKEDKDTNWDVCLFNNNNNNNNQEILDKISNSKIFPDEFSGFISMKNWMKYVMKED